MPRTRITPWAWACWILGLVVVLSILLAGGSVIWWMDKNHNLADTDIVSLEDYRAMRASFKHWALLGLQVGVPAAVLYLISLVMHLRSKHAGPIEEPGEVAPREPAPARGAGGEPRAPTGNEPNDEWD